MSVGWSFGLPGPFRVGGRVGLPRTGKRSSVTNAPLTTAEKRSAIHGYAVAGAALWLLLAVLGNTPWSGLCPALAIIGLPCLLVSLAYLPWLLVRAVVWAVKR